MVVLTTSMRFILETKRSMTVAVTDVKIMQIIPLDEHYHDGACWFQVDTRRVSGGSEVFHLSLNSDVVPNVWKHSIITPIKKKENANCDILENYRPIAQTSNVMKSKLSSERSKTKDRLRRAIRAKNHRWPFLQTDGIHLMHAVQRALEGAPL